MPTLRDIKQRISAVRSTAKITSAMKMVAAAKMRRAQMAIESARPYFSKLELMVGNLISDLADSYSHDLLSQRDEVNNVALVVISSDRGLCGSFNTNLFKYVINFIKEDLPNLHPNAKISILPTGRKAVGFFRKQAYPIILNMPGIMQNLNFEDAKTIIDTLASGYISGKYDKVYIFYNEFKSIIKQVPAIHNLLPIEPGKEQKASSTDFIFEPSKKEILDVLIPKLAGIRVWKSLLESNAAEQGSRMMAMDKATTNAYDLINNLELQYNKARQAAITKEMLEIVGGAEALKK